MNLVEARRASRVFAKGGGGAAPPPTPPLFIFSHAGVLQNICILLKPVMRAVCLQMGGAAPPPTPPLPLVETHRTSIVFAIGGGCAPSTPPLFIFSRASMLQNIRI